MLGNFVLTNYESLELYTANVFLFYWQNHGHIILIRTMMIPELNTLQQRHLNVSNFPNKLVGEYLGIFGGGVLPGFPTPSLRSRRCTRKNVCARRRHARGDLTLWPCFISSRIRNKVVFLTHILEFVFFVLEKHFWYCKCKPLYRQPSHSFQSFWPKKTTVQLLHKLA